MNYFTQTPSSARVKQHDSGGASGSTPALVRDGKLYSPATVTWRTRFTLPLQESKVKKEKEKVVVLHSRGTQASTPIKRTRNAKLSVKPETRHKGNQTSIEEKVLGPEEDETDSPQVVVASASTETSAIPSDGPESSRNMRRIAKSIEPIAAFVRKQSKVEVERQLILEDIKDTQENLQSKMHSVIEKTGDNMAKEEEILSAIQDCSDKVEPCRGPHVDEDTIMEIPEQLGIVREIISDYMEDFHSFATNIQFQLKTLSSGLKDLKGEQKELFIVIEQEKKAREEAQSQAKAVVETDSGFKEASKCTCAQMKAKSKDGSFIRCQNCRNSFQGKQFLKNNFLYNDLPQAEEVATRIGKIIQCIDNDAAGRLSFHISELNKQVKELDPAQKMEIITALYDLSMQRKSPKSSKVILSYVSKSKNERDRNNVFAKCLNGAVSSGKSDRLKEVLENVDQAERKDLINTPVTLSGNVKIYNVFEAIRNIDAQSLEYLITQGASLEVMEGDRSVLHEIIFMSSKRSNLTNKFIHDMDNILEVIYNNAGSWWKHRERIEVGSKSEIYNEVAISFLVSMKNKKNQNALQYAAAIAPPSIVKYIVNSFPYKFTTDSVSFGRYCGKTAYIVDEIEPTRGSRGQSSILDTIANREDMGNQMVQIEPFRTMLQDKWFRYRVFYWIWFLTYTMYLCVFSACAIGRHTDGESLGELYGRPGDYYRLGGELLCVVLLPLFFYGETCDYLRYGWQWRWDIERVEAFRLANASFVFCVLVTAFLRLALSPYEDIFLCFSLLIIWMMATQFLIPLSPSIGMFPIVYFKVFKDDFIKSYSWIFVFILLGSTIATYCAYQGSEEIVPEIPKGDFADATFSVIKLTFGFLETDYVTGARLPGLGIFLFIVYVWLGHILLLNLFIAMVNDTYAAIKFQQQDAWIRIKAWFAMLMDRRLPSAARIQFNGLSHLRQGNLTFRLITQLKMFTTTDLIYTKKVTLGVANQEEEQLIVIMP